MGVTADEEAKAVDEDTANVILVYLQRIRSAAALVARSDPMDSETGDLSDYLEQIARLLLQASHLDTLETPVDDLPARQELKSRNDPPPTEDDEIEDEQVLYKWRRVDYLRILLRSMAPIAMDVAARICTSFNEEYQSLFLLFSIWLPVAPHLEPLVTDVFRTFPQCPLTNISTPNWLLAEATHRLCRFYCRQMRHHKVLSSLWNWSPIFGWMNLEDEDNHPATKWHTVRAVAWLLQLSSQVKADFYADRGVEEELVPWVPHPWDLDREEEVVQSLYVEGRTTILWTNTGDEAFYMPSAELIREHIPLHPYLIEVGRGILFVRHDALQESISSLRPASLVHTETTAQNLARLGAALCAPYPILLTGQQGSGKSSLVREVARLFGGSNEDVLLELHVDEETDTKTLIGTYTATDIPGQFEWRPGALTRAVREGRWVLFEDLDTVPSEIQASLVQLLKDGLLPLGNGQLERCHPRFRLFATLTNKAGKGRVMFPAYWQKVEVDPLTSNELQEVAFGLYPELPNIVIQSALKVFCSMDPSGRKGEGLDRKMLKWSGRTPSVRDLFKLLARIKQTIIFEANAQYITEGQRTLCLGETFDVFIAACPDSHERANFVRSIAAPMWGISAELATSYVNLRGPEIILHPNATEMGRCRIHISNFQALNRKETATFAQTQNSLRLMESIAVCVRQNEPTLLVGETGCGKTTVLQHLASLCGRELIVQNLSLQTDSTDLLGGFRPLEIEHVARLVHQHFVDLFTFTFSRKQNASFLDFTTSALRKKQWKKLSQCFRRAAAQGLEKLEEKHKEGTSDKSSHESWNRFKSMADRFEQQRLACDSGFAFVFTEGALVDAIRCGSWVLLDEINLASSETLQRLCGLLDDSNSSITLTERGDSVALSRHPEFRLFAAMNPATDTGKRDLNANVRSRFTELYVDELIDPLELRKVAGRYLIGALPASEREPHHVESVIACVDTYLECRALSQTSLADGNGQRPRYTLRSLTRALSAAKSLVLKQHLSLQRALVEGFTLAFRGVLDEKSSKIVKKAIMSNLGKGLGSKEMQHPGRRPSGNEGSEYLLIKPFWIEKGPLDPIDWSSETIPEPRSKFILTPSTEKNLCRLTASIAAGPWPILLEGPTSAGKTTIVEYIAARCGHRVVRINNHEHTDIQEYTGGFTADANGSLTFQDGLLVRALRRGDWVILDELNLAPSDILEALNRLLDDNRELYLSEINETVKAHPLLRCMKNEEPVLLVGDVVNCHATTEISDLIGGLRPVRGHSAVLQSLLTCLRDLLFTSKMPWLPQTLEVPMNVRNLLERHDAVHLSEEDGEAIVRFAKSFLKSAKEKHLDDQDISAKRRKLNSADSTAIPFPEVDVPFELGHLELLIQRHHALFEWIDGSLVQAMKEGHMILLDEMSLAEDAVLERLNSVLEPARTLVLAEKGSSSSEDLVIKSHKRFRLFATMNPGGDFGKRELSPALRSRFTEIWVPPISEMRDIELVLGQSLSMSLDSSSVSRIMPPILEYIEWFNKNVCEDSQSQYRAFTLSLRDMITWTEFIVACSKSACIPIGDAILHGARMMHLDGLGLGTGGISFDDILKLKQLSESRIKDYMSHTTLEDSLSSPVRCVHGHFGAGPFQIPIGGHVVIDPPFSFRAQTPALNIQRVLRAMQLTKPILLEGSPGVGKTTLIAALASASGHHLTRINLSEQTDISDLMGTDLPVVEKNGSGTSQHSFRWRDGALLTAIKNGDWVLLDELNLAPQSVLEGLNSCLDHRASVFIPELGSTFECPPTFRVFAAQNPLGQGGGRKGLPKSFLNRFSKVYVDELTEADMVEICLESFASLDRRFVEQIVRFNTRLHSETCCGRLGTSGSPWEFNLRDIFRFLAVMGKKSENVLAVLSDLYIQRFRVSADREAARQLCKEYFGEIGHAPKTELRTSTSDICIDDVIVKRNKAIDCEQTEPLYNDTIPFFAQRESLRAASRCVMMNWPCLLVGNSTVGKTSVVRALADVVGARTIEVALSSSSDVSELVGTFEQADASEEVVSSIVTLLSMSERLLILIADAETSRALGSLIHDLKASIEQSKVELQNSVTKSLNLLAIVKEIKQGLLSSDDISFLSRVKSLFDKYILGKQRGEEGSFTWKDGPLVEAMKNGYWLHLKNANVCPSSVLDRLNPVMEPGGSLFLAEGGHDKQDVSAREIFAHPSFRVFLSCDPNYGEVSRAMRNRCVEISFVPSKELNTEIDTTNIQKGEGAKSSCISKPFSSLSGLTHLRPIMTVALSLIRRGLCFQSLNTYREICEAGLLSNENSRCLQLSDSVPLVDVLYIRDDWLIDPKLGDIRWRARVLQSYLQEDRTSTDWIKQQTSFQGILVVDGSADFIRDHLIVLILSSVMTEGRGKLYLSKIFSTMRRGARWIHRFLTDRKTVSESYNEYIDWRLIHRVPYLFQEHVWEKDLETKRPRCSSFVGVSVLELSYLVSYGNVGQSSIRCSVISCLVPYFLALDEWINYVEQNNSTPKYCLFELRSHRDALRQSLLASVYLEQRKQDHICFDTGEFIVQWCWLQKSVFSLSVDRGERRWMMLEKLTRTIHTIVFDTNDLTLAQSSPLKWSTVFLVPRIEDDWNVYLGLKRLASNLAVDRNASELLNLEKLLAIRHMLLFTDQEFRRRLLAAFSTLHLSLLDDLNEDGAVSGLKASLRSITETLSNEITRREREFYQVYDALCINPQVSESEYGYEIKDIESMTDDYVSTKNRYHFFTESVLETYSYMQLAPLLEERCEALEYNIIRLVAEIVTDTKNQEQAEELLQGVVAQIRQLINIALKGSLWCPSELEPFQSLIWLIESKKAHLKHDVLRGLLSIMCYNASARIFEGSKELSRRFLPTLELPSLIKSGISEDSVQALSLSRSVSGDKTLLLSHCFSMFASYFERNTGQRPTSPFMTIENQSVRKNQGINLLHLLAANSFHASTSRPHEILFLTQDIFFALRKSFASTESSTITRILACTDAFDAAKKTEILAICLSSTNGRLVKLVNSVVSPLLDSIWNIWSMDTQSPHFRQELGNARVLCGLLRFQLSIPDSPADPGQKAMYKISLLASRRDKLRTHFLARQVTSALLHGKISNDEQCQSIFSEIQALQSREQHEEEKVIRRPCPRPDFSFLYKETKAFSDAILDVTKTVALVNRVKGFQSSSAGDPKTLLSEISHFQSTSSAFSKMLSSKFEAYEDVVIPLCGSLALIQEGFATLADELASKENDAELFRRAMDTCLKFPFETRLDDLVDVLRYTEKAFHNDAHCLEEIYCCILSRLSIHAAVTGIDNGVLSCWLTVVGRLNEGSREDAANFMSLQKDITEDREEEEYREQFPDHRMFFQDALQDNSSDDGFDESDVGTSTEDTIQSRAACLDQDRIVLLASLHDQLFNPSSPVLSDFDRSRAFGISFAAAKRLHTKDDGQSFGVTPLGSISGFALAISLTSVSEISSFRAAPNYFIRKSVDFARDPNPSEVLRAAKPLSDLGARLSQLLSTFPGNSVLMGVLRVVECVRKTDVHKTPWGRVMRGLELILKHSQDWEQHASSRVKLGEALVAISQLVLHWRKLELASWQSLLSSREEKMEYNARRYWLRLHSAIVSVLEKSNQSQSKPRVSEFNCLTPEWITKKGPSGYSLPPTTEQCAAILKIFDTYCLSSPLGEFATRLEMLRSFSCQVGEEVRSGNHSEAHLSLALSLRSLYRYYRQFEGLLLQKMKELRRPIEIKLQKEVSLAKWDNKTYYAQAESIERNHRSLMKICREYDEALSTSVGVLIEPLLNQGIREPGSNDVPCYSIPLRNDFFSFSVHQTPVDSSVSPRHSSKIELQPGTYELASKMKRWCQKMSGFRAGSHISTVVLGQDIAKDISTCIFDRIESLRSKNSTRPMKERALTDLLRELKAQGYISTKWSLPSELREVEAIFQSSSIELTSTEIRDADQYYQRSVAEISSLRGEISVFGSKHLTSHQLDVVQAITDHGLLLLLQQRSIIARTQHFENETRKIVDGACDLLNHKADQSSYQRDRVWKLSITLNTLFETMKQLKFVLLSSMNLLEGEEATNWARDSIAQLESYIEKHENPLKRGQFLLVTDTHVDFVNRSAAFLATCSVLIDGLCRKSSDLVCLPSMVFEPCRNLCERAFKLANEFLQYQTKKVNSVVISASAPVQSKIERMKEIASATANSVLLGVQSLVKEKKEMAELEYEHVTILNIHQHLLSTSVDSLVQRLHQSLVECVESFQLVESEEDLPLHERGLLFRLMNDVGVLCFHALEVYGEYFMAIESFHKECSKLSYILLRVFRVLVAKGFCSDKVDDNGSAEDMNDGGGNFADDHDGTGMGEGEGRNDVTDQIESEEQLLGLKNDANEDSNNKDGSSKQLDKEEAEKGMEMEGDFEGEMYDVPEEEHGDSQDDDDKKEELDREFGDGDGENDDVIDEKLWGDSDEEDHRGEEKFEKNSSVKGENTSDEMMTRDDNDRDKKAEDEAPSKDETRDKSVEMEQDTDESNDINCDVEDNYEENHGIDVRGNDNHKVDQDDENEEMDMGDQLSLDNQDDVEENQGSTDEEALNDETVNEADHSEEKSVDGSTGVDESQVESSVAVGDKGEDDEDEPQPDDAQDNKDHLQHHEQQKESQSGLGVRNADGNDQVEGEPDENCASDSEHDAPQSNEGDASGNEANDTPNDGGNGSGKRGQNYSSGASRENRDQSLGDEFPNPLKSPGDASKFWFKKLNVINSHEKEEEMETGQDLSDDKNYSGDFEHASQDQANTTQTLGNVEENDEMLLDDNNELKGNDPSLKTESEVNNMKEANKSNQKKNSTHKDYPAQVNESQNADEVSDDMDTQSVDDQSENQSVSSTKMDDTEESLANIVVSDLSRMHVSNESQVTLSRKQIIVDEHNTIVHTEQIAEARARWSQIQSDTHALSRRLCEKLRLVMEPLVASKLRGDYRTGKRINMKRVISYIASGYRKDKIWLRRTKPAKRNYRVLLAVDDSESMLKGGAGEMALRALATLVTGMSQLEVGEVGVASFGEEMKLVHPFHQPFTTESGATLVQNFQFDQQRTRTALCVESALAALESPGDNASMQLVFLISDGRIERDSKDALRRLIREMMERNILLAMIVVEGGDKKESILNMKEVSFEKGTPKVTHFMEDYPFPYYILLEDIQTLPEVLGDVLRQWFEMLAQLQKGNS
ncbi:midasin [Fistulifera solaris]|uniref:Midasin n=1 Tax=Fistulifera solaris TaxID=1519565 RepID=A0A1Z5KFH3_FISSO|nr:midasin [Fistulifera solaris]|eukprot:GAX24956.1 midasin [Fistulifera solaris]